MFLKNKYFKIYYNLIDKRRKLHPDEYYERHHIIPVSLGGTNDISNIVNLTAREHFVAHALLIKITTGSMRYKMAYALCMFKGNSNKTNHYFNSRVYDIARRLTSESRKNIPVSQETAHRLRTMNLGRKHKPRSLEWKARQRLSHLGRKDPKSAFKNKSIAQSGSNNPRAKIWTVQVERDNSILTISALKTWCRENNLSFDKVARSRFLGEFYKGYRVIP